MFNPESMCDFTVTSSDFSIKTGNITVHLYLQNYLFAEQHWMKSAKSWAVEMQTRCDLWCKYDTAMNAWGQQLSIKVRYSLCRWEVLCTEHQRFRHYSDWGPILVGESSSSTYKLALSIYQLSFVITTLYIQIQAGPHESCEKLSCPKADEMRSVVPVLLIGTTGFVVY